MAARCDRRATCSNTEAFATATHPFDIGVIEDKLARQLGLHIVHLCSQQGELRLLLYEDSDPCSKQETMFEVKHMDGAPAYYKTQMLVTC